MPCEALNWRAQYRLDLAAPWSECWILDLSLAGAVVELAHDLPGDGRTRQQIFLHVDSIAGDDVGVVMRAVVIGHERPTLGGPVVDIEFDARREESLLLHLLVRLRALV